jgi:putative hydrolase of the HAD superfamily
LGIEKPNSAIFAHALDVSNAGADVWMVGDNPIADVQGAEQVGIRAILADGVYPDSRGVTIAEAARLIVSAQITY